MSNYETLGYEEGQDISFDELRKRYKQLAQEAHPDKGGTVEKFQKLKRAYDAIKGKVQARSATETITSGLFENLLNLDGI